jgi:hypothetical protein
MDMAPVAYVTAVVTDQSGNPVAGIPIRFISGDTAIVDFLFDSTYTDDAGKAANLLQFVYANMYTPPEDTSRRTPEVYASFGKRISDPSSVQIGWGVTVDFIFWGPFLIIQRILMIRLSHAMNRRSFWKLFLQGH